MGRTSKNIKLKIPEKPRKIKGFRSRSYRVATTISSVIASRYLAVFYEKIREPEIPAKYELTEHFDCFCEKF